MQKKFVRYYDLIVALLTFIAVFLIFIAVLRNNILEFSSLSSLKNSTDSARNIFTIFAIIVGGVISYIAFFRRRLFALRTKIAASLNVFPFDDSSFLHVLHLSVENIGSDTIWNPSVIARIRLRSPKGKHKDIFADLIDRSVFHLSDSNKNELIEPKELSNFYFETIVENSFSTVTYYITVFDDTDHRWFYAITGTNAVKSD